MQTTRKSLRTAVIVTAAVAAAALGIAAIIGFSTGFGRVSGGGAGGFTVEESRTFPAEGVEKVTVSAVSEKVRVLDSTDGRFSIRLYGDVRAARRDAVPRLFADSAGGLLTARVEHPLAAFPLWNDLTLEIRVPRGYARVLSAVTVSGELEIADHAYGALSAATTSGAVRIGTVRAETFEAHSTSGELEVESLAGREASFSTVSGEIVVKSLTGNLKARSTSGAIRMRFAGEPGSVDIGNTSGEVALALPAGSGFTLDAWSVSGGVSCEFPLTVSSHTERSLAGVVGSGTAAVRIQTVSGEIRISR
jgi:lia operon protein LiaG